MVVLRHYSMELNIWQHTHGGVGYVPPSSAMRMYATGGIRVRGRRRRLS